MSKQLLPTDWESENLFYQRFSLDDAALAKSIYDSNANLESKDPHFGDYPVSEFASHIQSDDSSLARDGAPKFFLRCICQRSDGKPIGYLQYELDAPEPSHSWLPMLVLIPKAQSKGLGFEVVNSLCEQAKRLGNVSTIGLNVYAENQHALRFWFRCGWRQILGVDLEITKGRNYTCLTLTKSLV